MEQVAGEVLHRQVQTPQVLPVIKALILDDSVFDRRRIRRLGHDTQLGIVLDEISSLDALETILDQEVFDVILLDYKLPVGDGLEALRQVRGHATNGNCPTIMIAGDAQSEIAVQSLKLGCDNYLAKDHLTAETLRAAVLGALEKSAGQAREYGLLHSDIERMTTLVMAKYTNALQPKLARMIRDMRALRSNLDAPGQNLPGEIEKIERQCIQMWAILLDPKVAAVTQEFRH